LTKDKIKVFAVIYFIFNLLTLNEFKSQSDSLKEQVTLRKLQQFLWLKDNQRIIDSCDKYLKSENLSNNFKSRIYSYKAMAISFMIDEEIAEDPKTKRNFFRKFSDIDELFKEAATLYPLRKTEYYCFAYEFFKNKDSDFYDLYKDSIIKYGYKPPIKSLVLNIDAYSGNKNWMGIETGVLFYDRFCRVGQKINRKKYNPDTYFPYSCSVLQFGFRKSLTDNSWAVNFSPVSGSYYWLNIRPINVCYYVTPSGNSICYSPEVGIHFWFIYVNYCKTFAFKENQKNIEGSLLNFKVQIPIIKLKN
jgi:hypothetical protein